MSVEVISGWVGPCKTKMSSVNCQRSSKSRFLAAYECSLSFLRTFPRWVSILNKLWHYKTSTLKTKSMLYTPDHSMRWSNFDTNKKWFGNSTGISAMDSLQAQIDHLGQMLSPYTRQVYLIGTSVLHVLSFLSAANTSNSTSCKTKTYWPMVVGKFCQTLQLPKQKPIPFWRVRGGQAS